MPNPSNPSAVIEFSLEKAGPAKITVFDISGRVVRALDEGNFAAGVNRVAWDGTDDFGNEVASGVYFYRLESQDFVSSKKMILMK